MIRKIIKIDADKCNGCGACAKACHEGAIGIVNGKAKLLREDYCDGLGDCLPSCPTGAITFEERVAKPFDEEAVDKKAAPSSCSTGAITFEEREAKPFDKKAAPSSCLRNWPVQIKLAPVNAPCFEKADLLIAADCTAYSYADFHREFIQGKSVLIGCPKLDSIDYSEKLTAILENNDIQSLTVVRMEVPCCGGLEMAVKKAINASEKSTAAGGEATAAGGEATNASKKSIPCNVIIISIDGKIIDKKLV